MSATGVLSPMAKKRSEAMTRISPTALEAAKLACAFRGMTLAEYLSLVVKEAADRDIDKGIAERQKAKK